MRRLSTWVSLSALCLIGCRATTLGELDRLAESPPATYSVLVSGGAFLEVDTRESASEGLTRTWPDLAAGAEAFPLVAVLDALQAGRAFVTVELDQSPAAQRLALARLAGSVPARAEDVQSILAGARARGHDLVLVVERLRDGGIDRRGINDQWPITAVTWLALGLGVLIPDHTYESRASVRLALREVQTGELLYQLPVNGGPVDLSLWERGSFLGIVTSILVPPFLVGDDDATVVQTVKSLSTRRLLVALVRQLKSFELRERLVERLPATISVTRRREGIAVQVEARESLSLVRVRIDGTPLEAGTIAGFEARLLGSETTSDGRWRYGADLALGIDSAKIQVIVQTVAGRVASVTVPMGSRP